MNPHLHHIALSLICVLTISACGCLGTAYEPATPEIVVSTPEETQTPPLPTPKPTLPPIEDIPFYIPGHTTVLPPQNITSQEFLETYGPINILPDVRQYTLMTFTDPIPDKGAEVIKLNFTVFGQEYSRILKNMHISGGLPNVYTYMGRINKSDESTVFFITVGSNENVLSIDFPWRQAYIQCTDVQNAEFGSKAEHPLHLAFAAGYLIPDDERQKIREQSPKLRDHDITMFLLPINETEFTEYDEIIHIGDDDYSQIPALRNLVPGKG